MAAECHPTQNHSGYRELNKAEKFCSRSYSILIPKQITGLVCLSLVLGLSVLLMGCSTPSTANNSPTSVAQQPQGQQLPISAEVEIGNQTIQLEVARTPQEQAMGLMFRSSLPDDRGMLFPVQPPRQLSFWMMNVPISLDMIFIRDGVVRYIAANAPPCTANPCPTYGPRIPIDSVIELRGGRAEELGLQVGDRISIQYLNP